MPTPLDKALQSKSAVIGFAGLVTAATAWMIWGTDMFPSEDPSGSKLRQVLDRSQLNYLDPEDWSKDDLYRWLQKRSLFPSMAMSRDELLQRVKANMRH